MIRLNLRLHRNMIIWWSLGLWALLAITPPSYLEYYPTLADRGPLVAGMRDNMGTKAMYGVFPPPGTIGQFTAWETGAWMSILSSVMVVLLMTSLHRGAEARGEVELIHSAGLPRSRILLSALVSSMLVAAVLGLGSALILLTLRYVSTEEISISGSLTFGCMITLTMIGFAAITSILQSLWGNTTNLSRLGLIAIAGAFLLRMSADTASWSFAARLNWVSPLGWRALILPFTDDDWGAIGTLTVICTGLITVALLLNSRREVNTSFIRGFRPRESGPRHVGSLISLNLLTHRGAIIAWSLTSGVIIVSMLPLLDSMIPLLAQDNATLKIIEDLLPAGEIQTEFIVYVFQMVAVLVAVAVTQPLVAYVGQERSRLIDAIRALGVRRYAPLWGAVVTAFATAVACTLLAIVGGVIALRIQDGEVANGDAMVIMAGLSFIPQTFIFIGIATVLAGWWPRVIHLAWLPVVAAATLSILGLLLGLSETQIDYSPLSHTLTPSGVKAEELIGFMGAGLVGILVGLIGAQRREIR